MQTKQHSTKQKQTRTPSASHIGPQQSIQRQPAPAHAYQHVSGGSQQQRAHSPADLLTLQQSIGNQAVQRLVARTAQGGTEPIQRKANNTGLPDKLKAGVERLSSMSMDDVHVHYNSSRPAQLQALAYTQGSEIHVGPGQERHLAHEAWHVVQQKQGRVKPTLQMKGVGINDDRGLEREADMMGAKALQAQTGGKDLSQTWTTLSHAEEKGRPTQLKVSSTDGVIQMLIQRWADFAQQDSPASRALDVVLASLSRSATSAMDAIERDGLTTLEILPSQSANPPGYTWFMANINGHFHHLQDICAPMNNENPLGSQINSNTPIVIYLYVFPNFSSPIIAAVLTHEITAHIIHVIPWLRKLRSGSYTGRELSHAWWETNQVGGLLHQDGSHETIGQGRNRAYNETAQNTYANLPQNERAAYRTQIRLEMDTTNPNQNVVPDYPI